MTRRPWWNPRLGIVCLCILLWIIHAVLKLVLAKYDIVSTIFAAGHHVPTWMIMCAALFEVIRLFVLLVVPGLLAWRAAIWVVASLSRGRSGASRKGRR